MLHIRSHPSWSMNTCPPSDKQQPDMDQEGGGGCPTLQERPVGFSDTILFHSPRGRFHLRTLARVGWFNSPQNCNTKYRTDDHHRTQETFILTSTSFLINPVLFCELSEKVFCNWNLNEPTETDVLLHVRHQQTPVGGLTCSR